MYIVAALSIILISKGRPEFPSRHPDRDTETAS